MRQEHQSDQKPFIVYGRVRHQAAQSGMTWFGQQEHQNEVEARSTLG